LAGKSRIGDEGDATSLVSFRVFIKLTPTISADMAMTTQTERLAAMYADFHNEGCAAVIEHAAQTGGYVYWSGIRKAWDFISYDEAHEMAADELAELHAVHIPKGYTP
jgi:hypothetical protein